MKRLAVLPLLALLLVTPACDTFGDDIAATVDGTDITISEVRALALSTIAEDDPDADEKRAAIDGDHLDGEAARAALQELITLEALDNEYARRKLSAEEADRTAASSQMEQRTGLPGDLKSRLLTLYTHAIAVQRTLAPAPEPEPVSLEAIAARAEELISQLTPEDLLLYCADSLLGPPETAEQVQDLIDAGTALTDVAAFQVTQYQPATDGGPLCSPISQLPPEIQEPFRTTPVGQLGRVTFAGQTGDGVLFFRPTGQRTLSATDEEVLGVAQQQLEQEAEQQAQADQASSQAAIDKAFRDLVRATDIDVDPRFGRFDVELGLLPPVAPVTTTTAPSSPATSTP